jgi:hypothetical protein
MSFTRITKGNVKGIGAGVSLTYANGNNIKDAKPGWTIETDGHGVITGRATFKSDGSKVIGQNQTHPADPRLKSFKSSTVADPDGTYSVTVDYIGIENGVRSEVVLSAEHSLSTAKIESHPKFNDLATADNGYDSNKKEWGTTKKGDKIVDPKNLKGTTGYLAPEIGISGFFYTSQSGDIKSLYKQVGYAYEAIQGIDNSLFEGLANATTNKTKQWLVTGCSFEKLHDTLYKVKFTARLSKECWNNDIYSPGSSKK